MSDAEVQVKFSADTHDLVTAKTGIRDIVGEMQSLDDANKNVKSSTEEATEGMGGLQLATAGVSRELIVLGHEVVSGNFSRIPGSLMVLQSRMGGLTLSTIGWTAAIAGTVAVLGEMVVSTERANEYMANMQNSLELSGRGYSFNQEQVQKTTKALHDLPGVTLEAARAMSTELASSARLTASDIDFLTQNVAKFASGSQETIPKAMQELATSLENPITALKKLDEQYNILTPHQKDMADNFAQLGDIAGAKALLIKTLGDRFQDMNVVVTPLQQSIKDLKDSWNDLMTSLGNSSIIQGAIDFLAKWNEAVAQMIKGNMKYEPVSGKNKDAGDKKSNEAQSYSKDEVNPQDVAGRDEYNQKQQQIKSMQASNRAAATEELADNRRLYSQDYDAFAENEKTQAALKNITIDQEYQDLAQAKGKEQALVMKSYDQEMRLYQQSSLEYKRLKAQELQAEQKFTQDVAKLQLQYLAAQKQQRAQELQEWRGMISSMASSFSSGITGMITGTMTLTQAFQGMARSILTSFIDMMVKKAELWAWDEIIGITSSKTQAVASIQSSAGEAFAAAYASTAAIPIVGPFLAPAAATTAATATESGGMSLLAYAQGAWEIDRDQVAMLHAGERVVPKSYAQGMKDDMANGGKSAGGGDTHVHFHMSALDGQSMKKMLNRHGDSIAKSVIASVRNGNRGSRPGAGLRG